MAAKVVFKGLDKAIAKLNREVDKIETRSMAGLIKGAMEIMNDTEKTSPKTPVDLGNLRASRFIVTAKAIPPVGGSFKGSDSGEMKAEHSAVKSAVQAEIAGEKNPIVVFGFSARYAAKVHEDMGGKSYTRKGSGAKFLEASVKRNTKKVIKILQDECSIG